MLGLGEFLDHLAWYWIVARQSQALRLKKDRDENVLRLITPTRSEEFLLRLFEMQEKIERGDTAALTYFPQLRALRVVRAGFALTLGQKFTDDDFSNLFAGLRRPFYDRVREFVSEPLYTTWRTKSVAIAKENRLPSYFGRYLSPEYSFVTPSFFQTLLQWNEQRGVTWLAFCDLSLDDAPQFPQWSLKRLNALTAGHDQHRHIRSKRQSWVQFVAADLDALEISRYSAMVRLLIDPEIGGDDAGELLHDGAFGLPGPTRLLVLPTTMLGRPLPPAPKSVRSTLLITNGTYAQVADELPVSSPDHVFSIFDVDSACDFLSAQPWVWSANKKDSAIAIRRVRDESELQDALLPSPLRQHVPVTDEVARALPRLERRHVRITGRPGSGKSTAVYHLLRHDFLDALAVITAPHLQARDADIIRALVRNAPNMGIGRVVLVIDDLQRYTETAFQLLTWAFAEDVTILMTSWSTEETRVAERFGPWLREEQHISIDAPDRAFIATLLTYCAKSLPDDLGTDIQIDALAEIYARRESTSHGIITRFVHGRLLDPTVDDQYWQRAYEALARERAHDERHILMGLAFLRQAGIPTTYDLLRSVLTVPKLDDHLATLAATGWLLVREQQIWIDDVQLLPALQDLAGNPTTIYRSLIERLLLEPIPESFVCAALDYAMGALHSRGNEDLLVRALHRLAASLPVTHPWLGAVSLELIRHDPVAGDEGMRRYLAAHPNAVHWWRDWVNAYSREPVRAAAVLKDALLTAPIDDEDDNLIDLAVFLAGTGSHGEAIFTMLQELGDTPIGAAVRDAIAREGNNLAQFRLRRLDE